MSHVFDFKDIKLRLDRMDKKPEVKEEPAPPVGFWAMYGGAAGGSVGAANPVTIATAHLPPYTPLTPSEVNDLCRQYRDAQLLALNPIFKIKI